MGSAWEWLKGKKTYIGLTVGAIVVVLHQFGITIPYIQIDDKAFVDNLWAIAVAAAGRHAIG